MTRLQAQASQIERQRADLVSVYGEDAVRQIDAEINRCIIEGGSMAPIEWLYSTYHRDIPVYEYGKMQIARQLEREVKHDAARL